jgi:hypothetical protein
MITDAFAFEWLAQLSFLKFNTSITPEVKVKYDNHSGGSFPITATPTVRLLFSPWDTVG